MSNVLNRATLQFLRSVNEPDYPEPDWIHEPDMSAVVNVPNRYWKLAGDAPVPMTQGEKDAVDAAADTIRKDNIRDQFQSDDLFKALARSVVQELNEIRAEIPGLAPRTPAEFRQRIRSNI